MTDGALSDADRDEVLEICRRTFQKPRPDGSLPRQFHAKTYACLRGELVLDAPSQAALRHGLFSKPGRYPAVARFSSSFFEADWRPDIRGMAIKLADVDGEVCAGAPSGQQDFVLMNEPTGPARDASEAAHLFRTFDGIPRMTPDALMAPGFLVERLVPPRIRWRYLQFLTTAALRHLLRRDLGRMAYHSVTAYRLGDGAVKYLVRPDTQAMARGSTRGRDFRARLQAALDTGPMGFDFCLQPRTGDDDSIEDARVAWKGPVFRVGRLEFPPQDVAATVAVGERLAFSPWNCLAAHAPLGSINALRRTAYSASTRHRGGDPTFPQQPSESADA